MKKKKFHNYLKKTEWKNLDLKKNGFEGNFFCSKKSMKYVFAVQAKKNGNDVVAKIKANFYFSFKNTFKADLNFWNCVEFQEINHKPILILKIFKLAIRQFSFVIVTRYVTSLFFTWGQFHQCAYEQLLRSKIPKAQKAA